MLSHGDVWETGGRGHDGGGGIEFSRVCCRFVFFSLSVKSQKNMSNIWIRLVRRGTGSWVGGATGEWVALPKDAQYPCIRGKREAESYFVLLVTSCSHEQLG